MITEFSKNGLAHALKLPEREFMVEMTAGERLHRSEIEEQSITKLIDDLRQNTNGSEGVQE